MPTNPKATSDRLGKFIAGWEEHAPDATFGDMTLAQFKQKVKPSLDARAEAAELLRKLKGVRVNRKKADAVSDELAIDVVNAVKGDKSYGENSPLYGSLGYVLKDDRKSGLTRKAKNAEKQNTELKVAA